MTKPKVRELHEDPLDFVLANVLRIIRTRRAELDAFLVAELGKQLDRFAASNGDEVRQIAAIGMAFQGIDPSGMLANAKEFIAQIEAKLDAETEEKTP